MEFEDCLPFKIEYIEKAKTIDPASCPAEILPKNPAQQTEIKSVIPSKANP